MIIFLSSIILTDNSYPLCRLCDFWYEAQNKKQEKKKLKKRFSRLGRHVSFEGF